LEVPKERYCRELGVLVQEGLSMGDGEGVEVGPGGVAGGLQQRVADEGVLLVDEGREQDASPAVEGGIVF